MRAGNFPPAENDGQIYLKIPLNKFSPVEAGRSGIAFPAAGTG